MTIITTYTHKGWFGLCPVLISEPDSEAPSLDPRWPGTEWLLDLSEVVFGLAFSVMEALNPEYEAMYPIRITGRLTAPVTREAEAEDGE